MPYCEEHNEVYNAAECPVCAGEGSSGSDDGGSGGGGSGGPDTGGIDEMVNDIVDSATDAAGGGDSDVVVGSQEKSVESESVTKIDRSTTDVDVDKSTEVRDDSTTVTDSVVKDSDIGSGGGSTEVDDSVVSDSTVGSEGRRSEVDSGTGARTTDPDPDPEPEPRRGGGDGGGEETQFCIFCGDEIPARASNCPACGEELSD